MSAFEFLLIFLLVFFPETSGNVLEMRDEDSVASKRDDDASVPSKKSAVYDTTLTQKMKDEIVEAHNLFRQAEGSSNMQKIVRTFVFSKYLIKILA